MSKSIFGAIVVASFTFFTIGCSQLLPQKKVEIVQSQYADVHIKSVPADLRLARTIKAADGRIHICDQPAVDVVKADTFGSKSKAQIPLTQGGTIITEGGVNSSTSVLQLNGRSSAVLLARDILYSECISRATGEQAPDFREAWRVVQAIASKEEEVAQINQMNVQKFLGLNPETVQTTKLEVLGSNIFKLSNEHHKCLSNANSDEGKRQDCHTNFKEGFDSLVKEKSL